MRKLIRASVVGASLLMLTVPAAAVGTRRVALRSGEDFKAGELQGVAVDATGKVRAGLTLGNVPLTDSASTWAALETKAGLLLATGSEGKLLKLDAGVSKELAKADAMALTSLVEAWDGQVIVSSLPGAKLYKYEKGKLTEWLTLKEAEHIFQLAYDPRAKVLYAATGPDGKLLRITKDKKAQVYFDAEEQHLMSVAVDRGTVYAGGGDKAKLYAVTGPGRATVLYDFGRTEVRAIAVDATYVYAIANEIKDKKSPSSKPPAPGDAKSSAGTKGKGTLYRFDRSGAPEELLDNKDEHFTALALDAEGKPYVGTGVEGRVYTVDDNHNSVLVADTEERQVTGLVLTGPQRYVISADPGVAHPIRGVGGKDAVWISKAIDAGLRARFGLLDWSAEGQIKLSTRSGNSAEPDDTWSPWTAELTRPGQVNSPSARFIQVRARFESDPKAVLSEVTLAFVTDNLRAVITSIDVASVSSKSVSPPDGKLRSSGAPIDKGPDTEIELSWKVDNPDEDELRYRIEYQLEGTKTWFDMLQPHTILTKSKYSWQTSDLPEGRYRVRVSAADELSNSPGLVTRHQLESHIFVVDNTAPELSDVIVNGRVVRGVATDGIGPIARIEFSLAGTNDWVPFSPSDGIFDSHREEFVADLSSLTPSGPALLTLRVYDQGNNAALRNITLR